VPGLLAGRGAGPGVEVVLATSSDGEGFTPAKLWNRTWGAPSYDVGDGICSDGEHLYTAGTTTFDGSSYLYALQKWDLEGNLLWNRSWAAPDSSSDARPCTDGTGVYVVAEDGKYDEMVHLLKYDAEGNLLWNRTWGDTTHTRGLDACTDGTSVFVTGYRTRWELGGNELFLLKYDAAGNFQWNRSWGVGACMTSRGCSVATDGDRVYVAGYREDDPLNRDVVVLKWDLAGNLLWNRTWGGVAHDYVRGIAAGGGRVFVAGDTESYGPGDDAAYLLEWDQAGYLIATHLWGGSGMDQACSVAVEGGSVYVAGGTGSYGPGPSSGFLLEYAVGGGLAWNGTWGGGGGETFNGVTVAGHYLYAVGGSASSGAGGGDLALVAWRVAPDLPGAPELLSAAPEPPGTGTVEVVWGPVPGADSYTVYSHETPITAVNSSVANRTGVPAGSNSTGKVSAVVTGLANGTYHIAVTASNGTGESAPSNDLEVLVLVSGDVPGFDPGLLLVAAGASAAVLAAAARDRPHRRRGGPE
ncbi:MAG: fibronectin type III domain-containing protein, partial [Promethearchaeota archaeon]